MSYLGFGKDFVNQNKLNQKITNQIVFDQIIQTDLIIEQENPFNLSLFKQNEDSYLQTAQIETQYVSYMYPKYYENNININNNNKQETFSFAFADEQHELFNQQQQQEEDGFCFFK